jgi:PAS domain S-box-containing protein
MTVTPGCETTTDSRSRQFPSNLVAVAAAELLFIAVLLLCSPSPTFSASAVVCSLCALPLGAVLLRRFQRDTRQVRRFARKAEVSTQAVLITDPRGRIKWTNAKFTELTGFKLDAAAGKSFAMLLHGHATDTPTVELIRNQMRTEQPFAVEILQYSQAGTAFWVNSRGEPIRDARGRLTHYVITQTDVSEQRRQTREIDQLASAIALDGAFEAEHFQSVDLDGVRPEPAASNAESTVAGQAEHPANDPALRLAQQLASLSSVDERDHLQQLVEGLKNRTVECIQQLPVSGTAESAQQS